MKKILITGATGRIGTELVKQLKELQVEFRSATRKPEEATNGVYFDYSDPATFEEAVEGADRVFVLGPPMVLKLDELLTPFLEFLNTKGIKRIVYLSAFNADKMQDLDFHTKIENKIISEGFNYTILRPSFFAENFRDYEGETINGRDMVYMPAGNGKTGFISVEDIARAAVKALTEEGHNEKIYNLTGPDALSYHDVASILTEVTGRQIAYPNPSPQEYKTTLTSGGAPEFIADYMISVYSAIANGHTGGITNDFKNLTGREPMSLKSVLQRDFA